MSDYALPLAVAAAAAGGAYVALRGGPSAVRPLPLAAAPPSTLSSYGDADRPFATADDREELPIRYAPEGVAASAPTTVFENFARVAKAKSDRVALRVERDGKWQQWTWGEYYDECMRAGKALVHLGVEQYDCVNIIGFNSPEWFFANLGAIAAGGKAAGIYTTNGPQACKYISEHSGARVVVVENEAQLDKFLAIRDELPNLTAIVVYAPDALSAAKAEAANADASKARVYGWADFMALADRVDDAVLAARVAAQRPGEVCTLIYTSGTTGNPKAVMITHDNVGFTAQSLIEMIPNDFGQNEEHVVSYLPLSHIAAQMVDIHLPIVAASLLPGNATVHFARPDALRGTLGDTLRAARPTMFFGVPRVWEKIAEKMKALGAKTTGVKRKLATWAKSCGAAAYAAEQSGSGNFTYPFGFPLAKALILDRVRAALGLDRCKICLTGAAPIQHDTLRYFGSLYIPIYELYGMSECTGPQTVSVPGANKLGSCGRALPGTALRIEHDATRDRAGEGEICYRGRHIMAGYMRNADKTKEAIDPDGWLHSGDVGRVDGDGFLYITGRIKELIITAGGENVAPVPMEDAVKEACPALSNVVMIGDKRKYNVCLVSLRCVEEARGDGTFTNEIAGAARAAVPGATARTVAEARADPAWRAYIEAGIEAANATAVSRASKIQKFYIIDGDFSVTQGTLTPTLKLKRPVVNKIFAKEIEALYK